MNAPSAGHGPALRCAGLQQPVTALLALITQTLLVPVGTHTFLALVLIDLRFPSLF